METGISKSQKTLTPATVGQLIAGMALFGAATPLSKIIGATFPVFTASFARMAIASAVLLPVVWFLTNRFKKARKSDYLVMAGIAAAGMVGFTATMLFGMRFTTGVIGSTLMSAAPAVTATAAVVFLGARMNWRKAGALSLAVAGCLAINLLREQESGRGDAVLFGAMLVAVAICFEAAYTLLSWQLSSDITSPEATLGASLMALPLFAILSLLLDPEPFRFSGADTAAWTALLFWGAATGGLAPVLWYNGVRQASGAMTAAAMSVMPLTALSLSYLLLGESPRWSHLIGFGLVFGGLILMIIEHAEGGS
jgi:drug/metabolite transporter (DMT)-like permease